MVGLRFRPCAAIGAGTDTYWDVCRAEVSAAICAEINRARAAKRYAVEAPPSGVLFLCATTNISVGRFNPHFEIARDLRDHLLAADVVINARLVYRRSRARLATAAFSQG
jgi:hypothetical protein